MKHGVWIPFFLLCLLFLLNGRGFSSPRPSCSSIRPTKSAPLLIPSFLASRDHRRICCSTTVMNSSWKRPSAPTQSQFAARRSSFLSAHAASGSEGASTSDRFHEWELPPSGASAPGSPYTRGPRPPSIEGCLFPSASGTTPEEQGEEPDQEEKEDKAIPRGVPKMALSEEEQRVVKKFGFLRRRSLSHFQNWHLKCRGQWPDFGLAVYPEVKTLSPISEPKILRLPLKYWNDYRSVSSSMAHAPHLLELFNQTALDPIVCTLPDPPEGGEGLPPPSSHSAAASSSSATNSDSAQSAESDFSDFHLPLEYVARWEPGRDRMGLGYGELNIFEDWPSWDPEFRLQLGEASNLTMVPQTGEFYQKFYIGPLNHGEGWTLGSALKAFALHRGPGYGITGIKLLPVEHDGASVRQRESGHPLDSHSAASAALKKRHSSNQEEAGDDFNTSASDSSSEKESWREAALRGLQVAAFPGLTPPEGPSMKEEQTQTQSPSFINRVPGVEEDLLEIALNIKSLALKNPVPFLSARVRVKAKGPVKLLGGHLRLPYGFRVCNPEHYIATLEEGATLNLDFLIEWGRGLWLADGKGLCREEEGFNYRCFKRRPLALTPEVPDCLRKHIDLKLTEQRASSGEEDTRFDEEFFPTGCNFGSCNRVRLAVHKMIGSRWCSDRNECPDPRDQLVVEIWSKRSHTPKQVLLHALYEMQAAAAYAKRQLLEDADGWKEEQILTGGWSQVSRALERQRIEEIKGPPICEPAQDGTFRFQNEEDAKRAIPRTAPKPPAIDPQTWLLQEQLGEVGQGTFPWDPTETQPLQPSDATSSDDENEGPTAEPASPEKKGEAEQEEAGLLTPIATLNIPAKALKALNECGIHHLEELCLYSEKQLRKIPGLSSAVVDQLQLALHHKSGFEFAPD